MSLELNKLAFLDWESVSLEVQAGEVIAFLGESGSGKSLLLRSIADLIPHEGSASLSGVPSSQMIPTEWRKRVGFLAAEILWWEETVGAHFISPPDANRLASLGISGECMDWHPHRLSMGERQRLGILRLLDREPEVLLLDEPTSNLDGKTGKMVEDLLLNYVRDRGACAIWVSHSEEQAERVASRIFRMEQKRLQEVVTK